MFTISEGKKLTATIIKQAIKYNEKERKRYNRLERYYRGDHDILHRIKPPTAKNNRVVINHASYIVDTNTGYLLGNPVEYQIEDEINIDEVLQQYKMQTIADLDHEMAKDSGTFGIQYELEYNVDNDVKSVNIDNRNAICIYDDTVEHSKMYGVIYKMKEDYSNNIEEIVAYDKVASYECKVEGKSVTIGKAKPHMFGIVPLLEFRNNSEYQGDFEQVMGLIDAYNLLQSDRINDKEQLVEAILVGYGFTLEKEQMAELLENRTMFGVPVDAKVEYLIKSLDEGQIDILRQTIENDIHKISKVPNMSDEEFAGNSSGVALAYKLLSFNQNVMNKERYFEKGLLERFEAYNNYLVAINKMKKVEKFDVKVVFKRNLPSNLLEISQVINNLQGIVDTKTLLGQIPFIEDADKVIKAKEDEDKMKFGGEVGEFGTLDETTARVGEEAKKEVGKKRETLLEKITKLLK